MFKKDTKKDIESAENYFQNFDDYYNDNGSTSYPVKDQNPPQQVSKKFFKLTIRFKLLVLQAFSYLKLNSLAYAKARTTCFLLKHGPRSDGIRDYHKTSDHRPFCREFNERGTFKTFYLIVTYYVLKI
ncbi:hypothetical protein BpHYR1_014739 [Brachionus plicatilis]|uniref:Uncharacterized protein n=1 Tax=Brachionus plicatilis TaxID=10195 RepID=A0A3M7T6V6_BRAPC|nr:hypothetical protein BpHYR1_014739 [Brachionus plicatilis]